MTMAGETILTIVGALTADPEMRFTPSGAAVANFTIASNSRHFDKQTNEWVDDPAVFMRCNIWREAAENVVETLTRGMRVIATGRLKQRSFETREGDKRTVMELEVDEIGPSLKWATAKVNKITKSGGNGGRSGSSSSSAEEWGDSRGGGGQSRSGRPSGGQSSRSTQPADDPWGSAPPARDRQASFDDEPPF